MKHLLNFILLATLIVFSTCNKDDKEDPLPTTGEISGKITDANTGQAIEGANVKSQPVTSSVSSDSAGLYTIPNVSPGEYSIIATKTNYISDTIEVTTSAASATPGDIVLTPIIPNKPPTQPENIAPKPDTVNQLTSLTLAWSATDPDGDTLTYKVLFDTVSPPVESILSAYDSTAFSLDSLENGTTYYWQVIVTDIHDATTTGEVWKFTTLVPNNAPNKPENIAPTPGAIDQPSSLTLKWSGSDPDGDSLTYKVLLSTVNPPVEMVASEYDDTELQMNNLEYSTTYYWQIIAQDSSNAVTESDVWEFTTKAPSEPITTLEEDFEMGIGDWNAENGLWEVGDPELRPADAHSGDQAAGTILNGGYHNNVSTRLISPDIILPNVASEEEIQLKYWHWYRFAAGDQGVVQISVDEGEWETVSVVFDGESQAWTQHIIDLSEYAGKNVRLAFYFTSDGMFGSDGWYIDDISVEKKVVTFNNPEDFEMGIGDWNAENGLWEVGDPELRPADAHSGDQAAGTILNGGYHNNVSTRLISPDIILPNVASEEEIQLKYWHWYRFAAGDQGVVQISVDEGEWETVSVVFDGESQAWTQHIIDLSEYAGKNVRLAFYFTSDGMFGSDGWYIDDVSVEKN